MTYVSSYQALGPGFCMASRRESSLPFPLGSPSSSYFYRARNAIYHLFRALISTKGDAVLVPDYHSGNEVWAIRAAGARLSYYPIRRDLSIDLDDLERLLRSRPRALLVIHYLGWPQRIEEIRRMCDEHEVLLVEDCALSLLSQGEGRPLGSFGDFSVFCLYKTLPVPNGGMLVQNRHRMSELERMSLQPCSRRSAAGRCAELGLAWLRGRSAMVGKTLGAVKWTVGRSLDLLGVSRHPVGEIGFDISLVDLAMSPVSHSVMGRLDYETIFETRRRNYARLAGLLSGRVRLLLEDLPDGVCPLFFPILVADKHRAATSLLRRGVEAVEFWNYGDPEADGRGRSDASYLRRHVLELPIHQDLSLRHIDYIARQVVDLRLSS